MNLNEFIFPYYKDINYPIVINEMFNLYDAYIKYLSQLCHGLKTDIIIYKKSEQGTGKSTESEFIMNHVLGKDLCIQSNTEPLLTDRNKCYMGKLFIIFEELPTFGKSQWEGVSSKLKTFTTERTTNINFSLYMGEAMPRVG